MDPVDLTRDAHAVPAVPWSGGDLVLEVRATAREAAPLRHALTAWAARRGLPSAIVEDIALAASEAIGNAVDHAYPPGRPGTVRLCAGIEPGRLTLTVTDTGHWDHTPSAPHRGRGITILRAVSHDATITTTEAGTTVRMTWSLPTPPPSERTTTNQPAEPEEVSSRAPER